MPQFLGFDHVDTRVRSLTAVEAFYDKLMPEIGLPEKQCHIVDAAGAWRRAKPGENYNTIEYHEKPSDRRPAHFIGFIEDPAMKPVSTRIAFRIASVGELDRWIALLGRIGRAISSRLPPMMIGRRCSLRIRQARSSRSSRANPRCCVTP